MEDNQVALPDTVTVLKAFNGSVVYLVGTVHYSKKSQEDVAQVINAVKPHSVVLELCHGRAGILSFDGSTTSSSSALGLIKSIKKGSFTEDISDLLMTNLSEKLTYYFGEIPGGEFRRAVLEAKKCDSYIYLGDRCIYITIKRVISTLSWRKSIRLLTQLLFTADFKIKKEDVEKYKNKDLLEAFMLKMDADFPELEKVIIDERDQVLTHTLQYHAGIVIDENDMELSIVSRPQIVVGVVGLGHVAGIKNYWETISEEKFNELFIIPPQSRSCKIIKIVFNISIYGLILWGVSKIPGVKLLSKMAYHAVTCAACRACPQGRFIKVNKDNHENYTAPYDNEYGYDN